jgi:hypothetical protein
MLFSFIPLSISHCPITRFSCTEVALRNDQITLQEIERKLRETVRSIIFENLITEIQETTSTAALDNTYGVFRRGALVGYNFNLSLCILLLGRLIAISNSRSEP